MKIYKKAKVTRLKLLCGGYAFWDGERWYVKRTKRSLKAVFSAMALLTTAEGLSFSHFPPVMARLGFL